MPRHGTKVHVRRWTTATSSHSTQLMPGSDSARIIIIIINRCFLDEEPWRYVCNSSSIRFQARSPHFMHMEHKLLQDDIWENYQAIYTSIPIKISSQLQNVETASVIFVHSSKVLRVRLCAKYGLCP